MTTWGVLLLGVVFTSFVSGVLGMAGGLILMGLLTLLCSVQMAMILHGATQTFSNGVRAALLWRSIAWRVLAPYALGAGAATGLFVWVQLSPDRKLLCILLGLVGLAQLVAPKRWGLDIEDRRVAVGCGFVVTGAQLFAGVSGPLLDVFYVRSKLERQTVVATKATTQTLGHILKLLYYGAFLRGVASEQPPLWIFGGLFAAAFIGTWMGRSVLRRLSDHQFREVGRWVVAGLGLVYLLRGLLGE